MLRTRAHAALAVIALAPAPLFAQTAATPDATTDPTVVPAAGTDKLIYTPADFARFAPRTALDMIKQVPGFTLNEPAEQQRGLGEANTNVVVNRQRLATKSDKPSDLLARISASDVIRIELIEGSSLNIPGLNGQIANIVTRPSGMKGQFTWEPQLPGRAYKGRWYQGSIAISGTQGQLGYRLSLSNAPFYGGALGKNVVVYGAGVRERRFSRNLNTQDIPRLNGALSWTSKSGIVVNLSAGFEREWFYKLEEEFGDASIAAASHRRVTIHNKEHEYEYGSDVTVPLGGASLKLIGLAAGESGHFYTIGTFDPATGAATTGTRFDRDSDSSERIARSELSFAGLGGEWQASAEAAFNRLDRVGGLAVLDAKGSFNQVPFAAGTGGVKESRYQGALTYGRPLGAKLSFQLTAGGEYSRISQNGANALARTFVRPKGALTLGWTPRAGTSLTLRVAREVGQLDFGDFLAEADLENNQANAGNNQLRPDQKWGLSLETRRDFGRWGSATLTLFHDAITDYVTIVPLPGNVESVGNVASARESGAKLKATLRLDPLGLAGGKVDVDLAEAHSAFRDPLDGKLRPFDSIERRNIKINPRYDPPGSVWAFGSEFRRTWYTGYARLAEVGLDHIVDTFGALYVENKAFHGLSVRLQISNLLNGHGHFERTLYAGPRNSSPVLQVEERNRYPGPFMFASIKGGF